MKAQMFIVTMIFLIGLVFAVQGSLMQYSSLDMANAFGGDDFYVFKGVEQSFGIVTGDSRGGCGPAEGNVQELESFIKRSFVPGTLLEITAALDCSQWGGKPLNLTVHVKSMGMDTTEHFIL